MIEHLPSPRGASGNTAPDPTQFCWFIHDVCESLGERFALFDEDGGRIEALCFRPDLSATPGFEAALHHGIRELASVSPFAAGRVRISDRESADLTTTILSDVPDGIRISEIIETSSAGEELDATTAIALGCEILVATSTLSPIIHGALAAERLVMLATRRIAILDCGMAAALRTIPNTRARLWSELTIPMPPGTWSSPPFTVRSDAMQASIVILELLLGRRLDPREFPGALPTLAQQAAERVSSIMPPAGLREWFDRSLSITNASYRDAADAFEALVRCPGCPSSETRRTALGALATTWRLRGADRDLPESELELETETTTETESDTEAETEPRASRLFPPPSTLVKQDARPAVQPVAPIVQQPVVPIAKAVEPTAQQPVVPIVERPAAPSVSVQQPAVPIVHQAVAPIVHKPVAPTAQQPTVPNVRVPFEVPSKDQSSFSEIPEPAPAQWPKIAGAAAVLGLVLVGAVVAWRGSQSTPTVVPVPAPAVVATPSQPAPSPQPSTADTVADRPVAPPAPASAIPQAVAPIALPPTAAPPAAPAPAVDRTARTKPVVPTPARPAAPVPAPRAARTATPPPLVLTGIANFNAIPWANVSIDGSPRGQTPLGNVTLPVGTHEVVFSHPELGTLRRSITITADRPTRLSVTLGQQP